MKSLILLLVSGGCRVGLIKKLNFGKDNRINIEREREREREATCGARSV